MYSVESEAITFCCGDIYSKLFELNGFEIEGSKNDDNDKNGTTAIPVTTSNPSIYDLTRNDANVGGVEYTIVVLYAIGVWLKNVNNPL